MWGRFLGTGNAGRSVILKEVKPVSRANGLRIGSRDAARWASWWNQSQWGCVQWCGRDNMVVIGRGHQKLESYPWALRLQETGDLKNVSREDCTACRAESAEWHSLKGRIDCHHTAYRSHQWRWLYRERGQSSGSAIVQLHVGVFSGEGFGYEHYHTCQPLGLEGVAIRLGDHQGFFFFFLKISYTLQDRNFSEQETACGTLVTSGIVTSRVSNTDKT